MNKTELRKYAKEYRKSIPVRELSKKIHENLFSLAEWNSAVNVFSYLSIDNEVDTKELLMLKNKNWYLPKVENQNMLVCPYKNCNLISNKYKIPEPDTNPVNPNIIDLIIIPALAVDKNGYRLGYGGGFYDRFLMSLKHTPIKVVLAYSDLLFDDIPKEQFDQKCDIIITDKEILNFNC